MFLYRPECYMEEAVMKIGETLEKYRRNRTYQDIKDNTGVSKGTYSQIVNGLTVSPDVETLRKLAFYFGDTEDEKREMYAEFMLSAGYIEPMPRRVKAALVHREDPEDVDPAILRDLKANDPETYYMFLAGTLGPNWKVIVEDVASMLSVESASGG